MESKSYKCLWQCKHGKDNLCCFSCNEKECPDRCQDPIDFCEVNDDTDEIKIHELKTLPKYFELVRMGVKNFEVRKNDRDFEVGDILLLREWNDEYTGKEQRREIGYILDDKNYCKEGYVILGFVISQGGRL